MFSDAFKKGRTVSSYAEAVFYSQNENQLFERKVDTTCINSLLLLISIYRVCYADRHGIEYLLQWDEQERRNLKKYHFPNL